MVHLVVLQSPNLLNVHAYFKKFFFYRRREDKGWDEEKGKKGRNNLEINSLH